MQTHKISSMSTNGRMNSIKATSNSSAATKILVGLLFLGQLATLVHSQCFQDESMNAQWARLINGDETSTTFNIDGTCCQDTVCNIPCAADVPPPPKVNAILIIWWRYRCHHAVAHSNYNILISFVDLLCISHLDRFNLLDSNCNDRDLVLPSSLPSYSSLSLGLPRQSLSRARARTSSWPDVRCLCGCVVSYVYLTLLASLAMMLSDCVVFHFLTF